MVNAALRQPQLGRQRRRPAGQETGPCVHRAGERYYFLRKLSMEPTRTERDTANGAPTDRPRLVAELRDRLPSARSTAT